MFDSVIEISVLDKNSPTQEVKKYPFKLTYLYSNQCYEFLVKYMEHFNTRPAVFGVSLKVLLQRENRGNSIPIIVEKLMNFIETKAINLEGIFRVSSSKNQLEKLQHQIDEGIEIDFSEHDYHLATGLLKKYFRDLPDPIFTEEFYSCFLIVYQTTSIVGGEFIAEKYKKLLELLPKDNRILSKRLLDFLAEVAKHNEKNKMTTRNVATVWGPLVLRNSRVMDAESIQEAGFIAGMLITLLDRRHEIF